MTLLGIVGEDKSIFDKYAKGLRFYDDEYVRIYTNGKFSNSKDDVLIFCDEPSINGIIDSNDLSLQTAPIRWGSYDKKDKELCLYTDHVALKKIYYTFHDGNFVFSSNLDVLVKALDLGDRIDHLALSYYYQYGFVPPPYTLFAKVFKLGPGEFIRYDAKRQRSMTYRYWRLNITPQKDMKLSCALDLVRNAIKEAVQLVALTKFTKKCAIAISGGLDSTTICALIKDMNPIVITLANLDESKTAELVCDFLGLNLVKLYITEDEFIKALKPSFQALQEPLAGIDIVPSTFVLLSSAKSRGAEVMLTGDGGDEAFFGYPWVYKCEFRYNMLKFLPRTLAHELGKAVKKIHDNVPNRISKYISVFMVPLTYRAKIDRRFESDEPITRWYRAMYENIAFNPHGAGRVEEIAHNIGLELKVPFLDRKFIETLFQVPFRLKQPSINETKLILRLILLRDNILPREVILGRKKGLASDIWFSSKTIKECIKIITESRNPYIDLKVVDKAYRLKKYSILSLLTGFSLWYEKYER